MLLFFFTILSITVRKFPRSGQVLKLNTEREFAGELNFEREFVEKRFNGNRALSWHGKVEILSCEKLHTLELKVKGNKQTPAKRERLKLLVLLLCFS